MKFYCLLLSVVLLGCSSRTAESLEQSPSGDTLAVGSGFDDNNFESFLDLNNYLSEEPDAADEVFAVDSTCVVVIEITDEQLAKLEEKMGEDFVTAMDDYSFYRSEASSRIDSAGIAEVHTEKRFIHFRGDSRSWTLDVRKEGAPYWIVILFKKDTQPELVNIVDLTSEKLGEYFRERP